MHFSIASWISAYTRVIYKCNTPLKRYESHLSNGVSFIKFRSVHCNQSKVWFLQAAVTYITNMTSAGITQKVWNSWTEFNVQHTILKLRILSFQWYITSVYQLTRIGKIGCIQVAAYIQLYVYAGSVSKIRAERINNLRYFCGQLMVSVTVVSFCFLINSY